MRRAVHENGLFGRYLLLEQLGQGGMAQIWRARLAAAEAGSRELVLKTLHPRLVGQKLFAERLAAAARVNKLLSHPGIVRVVDDGAVKRMPFLAMERVDGVDLGALCRVVPAGRRVPVGVVLAVAIEMCRAVGYAHAWRDSHGRHRAIVHGDLCPSNIMVRRDGGVALLDFGSAHMDARIAQGAGHLVIGKSGYFAPELLDDAAADPRSDVFSLGVVLHELLSGRLLFVVESERETLRRVSEAPIPPPSRTNSRVTPALDEIVLRALGRDPAHRFASANELASALERLGAPARAPRVQVAEFVRSVLVGTPRCDEAFSSELTPAVRPRRPAPATPDEQTRPPRRRASVFGRVLVACAILMVAMLIPLPRVPAGWHPPDGAAVARWIANPFGSR